MNRGSLIKRQCGIDDSQAEIIHSGSDYFPLYSLRDKFVGHQMTIIELSQAHIKAMQLWVLLQEISEVIEVIKMK